MAIKIPSKNIYDKSLQKVRDNIINRVDFGVVEVIEKIENKTTIFNHTIEDFSKPALSKYRSDLAWDFYLLDSGNKYFSQVFAYYSRRATWIEVPSITIKKIDFDREILSFVPDSEEEFYGLSLNFKLKKGTATADLIYGENKIVSSTGLVDRDYIANAKVLNVKTNYQSDGESKQGDFDIGTTYSYTHDYGFGFQKITATAVIDEPFFKIIGNMTYYETEDGYKFSSFKVLCSSEVVKIPFGATIYNPDGIKESDLANNREITGECENYIPEKLSFYVNGKVFSIDIRETTFITGEKSSSKAIKLESNELIQTENYYYYIDYDEFGNVNYEVFEAGEKYYEELLSSEITSARYGYGSGKETATIRCSISDYYDYTTGNKFIAIDNSTGKMSFDIGDRVVPMVYGADGKDHPMSTHKDGSPKVFQVLGSNIYYDGAVWQELSLQEVDKSENL